MNKSSKENFLIIIISVAIVGGYLLVKFHKKYKTQIESAKINVSQKLAKNPAAEISANKVSVSSEITQIPVNDPMEFNYKTKAEIYDIRKTFVAQSLFKNSSYQPSEAVFGKIEGGKPWRGLIREVCSNDARYASYGDSEESRFINNPSALIMLDGGLPPDQEVFPCDREMFLLPQSITYYKKENTLKIQIPMKKFLETLQKNYRIKFQINGLNARDFGYEWVYADSYGNVNFENKARVQAEPQQFKNFIHLGQSCGIAGGCNNGSPSQEELAFFIFPAQPAKIHFKLWKNKPGTRYKTDKADMNVELDLY
jgi:hypothetical protein